MNKYFLTILLISTSGIGSGQINEAINAQLAQESPITNIQSELIFEKVKSLPNQTQLSIALIQNGQTTFYGVIREKDSVYSIANFKAVFEIGSISKVFTATLLSSFVLENKVKLENNINEYLHFTMKDSIAISFKQLATHTSGLPRLPERLSSPFLSLANPYKEYGEEELISYLNTKLELINTPGTASSYSNLGFGVLGFVLSIIDDTTYENLLQSKICSKYDMIATTTVRKQIENQLVIGLNDKGEEVSNWDMAVHVGAGGILSNVQDLSKFSMAQFNDSNKELALTRANHYKVNDNFVSGLGWALIKQDDDNVWLWHNGGTGGYTSSIILNTNTKNGIIVLSNISAIGALSKNIAGLSPELMNTLE